MDSLPPPINGRRPRVPFYARKRVYTPEDFINRPSAEGYHDLDLLAEFGLKQGTGRETANAFLQEWLYFSFLARVIGEPVNSEDFYDSTRNCVQLTNHILEHKIRDWQQRNWDVEQKESAAEQASFIRASDAFAIARRFISKHLSGKAQGADYGHPGQALDPIVSTGLNTATCQGVDPVLALSIAILGEILQRQRPYLNESWEDHNGPWDSSAEPRWGYSTWCRDQLKKNNWCPSEIWRLESLMPGVCEVYYASGIQRKLEKDHSKCDWIHCSAEDKLSPRHFDDCDGTNCIEEYLDEKQIEDTVLKSGKTPFVKCDEKTGRAVIYPIDLNAPHLEDFGALSHAWKDRILDIGRDARGGNNRRVYRCQLQKLQKDFNKLVKGQSGAQAHEGGNVPFYVDALCYPRQVAVQVIALNQMRQIYSRAKTVLIWDRELLSERKFSESKMIEMNTRIRVGNWTKSLWTLLEAVLAQGSCRLHVAFKDDTVTFEDLEQAKRLAKNDLFHEYHHVYRAGRPFSTAVYHLRKLDQRKDDTRANHRAGWVWDAVQFQELDRAENEALILAALLKIDVTKFETNRKDGSKECLAASRMNDLLTLMNRSKGLGIPSGIIFMPFPKLKIGMVDHSRDSGWAPRTWLTRQAHTQSFRNALHVTADRLDTGLKVEFPGLVIYPTTPSISKTFWVTFRQSMHKWFKVYIHPPVCDKGQWWAESYPHKDELIIIMAEDNPRELGTMALLVKKKGTLSNGKIEWVDSICQAWVRLETNREIINKRIQEFRQGQGNTAIGKRINKQQWCIDSAVAYS